jgi:thiamine monophosphate synthase
MLTQVQQFSKMLMTMKPWAVFVAIKCESGKRGTQLVYLKDKETVQDALYRVSQKLNEASGKHGLNFWIDDHHVINSQDVDNSSLYRLS